MNRHRARKPRRVIRLTDRHGKPVVLRVNLQPELVDYYRALSERYVFEKARRAA